MYDYHVHTTYSDGYLLPQMVEAAVDAGLNGVGLTDHCTVSERESRHRYRETYGLNLDRTYERRRTAIENYRDRVDIEIFDAVEMDYHPADEEAIAEFLDTAGFDYAIGSVHEADGATIHQDYYSTLSREGKRRAVAAYFDHLVSLIESGLFDVLAHPDLVERNPALRGIVTTDQYDRVAETLVEHDIAVEINAGRVLDEYGELHPAPEFRERLADHGVRFVPGSDSHRPDELRQRIPVLAEEFDGDAAPIHADA